MQTRLVQDRRGAVAVEMAIVFGVLLVLTISLIEFALALWQWNSAEKATQLGVRYAVESDPVASGFTDYSGIDAGFEPGTSLDTSKVNSFTVTCDATQCTCDGAGCGDFTGSGGGNLNHDVAAFDAIVDRMRGIFPRVQDGNVVVEYRHVGMGFAGRLGTDLVPTVTVELQGLTFDFLLLSFLGPLLYGATTVPAGIPMPAFAATLTGEDLASAGPS